MHRSNLLLPLLALTLFLLGCQLFAPATPPPPLTVSVDEEFVLAPGQSATVADTGLTFTLMAVSSDERCPSEIECAASGPVTLTISAQKGSEEAVEFTLQTFTSNNGLAPTMEFEGIQDRITFEGYEIKVISVLPYPARSKTEIKDSDYRVGFLVTHGATKIILDRISILHIIRPNVNNLSTQNSTAPAKPVQEQSCLFLHKGRCFLLFEIGESLLATLFFIFTHKEKQCPQKPNPLS